MQSHQSLIDQLNRKIALLDQYASTLQKQNLAKNNETSTLYAQLNDIRNQNDILRSHLSRINQENLERIKKEQSFVMIEIKNHSVNSSVQLQQVNEQLIEDTQRTKTEQTTVSCQTDFQQPSTDPMIIHQSCTEQITKLLQTTQQKDNKITQISRQSQQMYETIIQLQQENQHLRKQYIEVQSKFKTQSKQMKSYQTEIQQLRNLLNEERETIEQERLHMQAQKQNNSAVESQVQRLIRDNNRLIEKIRMLEKQKNTFYAQLRGKNVSPLKTSQISSRQNIPFNTSNSSVKPSFTGIPYVSSDQKPQPQRFSSQFGIGKQKEKLKADRWRKIEEKINRVKEENQALRANLAIN